MVASIIMYSLSGSLANSLKIVQSSTLRPPAEPLVDDFPIAETLRKVAPRNASSVPEKNGLHKQPIVSRRAAHMSFSAGQKILDPIPLVIT